MRTRYQVRSVTGYPIRRNYNTPGNARAGTDWMVLDSWECWRVVKYFGTADRKGFKPRGVAAARRNAAYTCAAELNMVTV